MRPALVTMVFLGGLQFAVSNAQIKFDPRIRWNTFETRHCVVHYPQGEDSLAQVVAQKAERYLQRLSGIFHEAPHDKVEIVLDTSSDIVFGAATPIPHLAVFLNPTPTHLGLGHFDDWLDLIIAHELTHAVDLDKLGGLPSAIRSLIGRLYFPGALGPQWLTEGIATHFETELTGAGRGLDPFHDMILRMAFLEDRVTAADQNTTFLSRWPGGNSAYVYGMSFYRYLARHYGQEAIIKLRERYANNLIPFRASEAVSAATSKGLKPAYRDWQEEMRHRYEQQAEAIRQTGLTPSRQLTHLGYDNWSPEWSADGKTLYFVSNDANKHQEIRAVNLATGEQKKIKAVNLFETQLSHATSLGREWLFMSRTELERSYSLRNDIWRLDPVSGVFERLTKGQRARHPAVDPTGNKLVYVTSTSGQTDLWEYDLRRKTATLLLAGGPDRLFFNPAWSPQGDRLALSIWERGGYQNIWIFDLADRRLRPLLQDKAWDVTPCWSHDGRYLVFSSDRTGVFNLFAYELESHRLQQITNVLAGAFDPAISPDDGRIAFTGYSSRGFDVHVMDWHKDEAVRTHKVILGVDIPRSPLFVYGYADTLRPVANSSLPAAIRPAHYTPWRTLRPRFYIPLPIRDEKGPGLGVITYGQDVLSKHVYLLSMQYGFLSRRLGYSLRYANNNFYPTFNLRLSDFPVLRGGRVINEAGEQVEYWERRRRLGAEVVIPFLKIDTGQFFSLGVHWRRYRRAFALHPQLRNPYFEGDLGSVAVRYTFSNAHRFAGSIGPVEGMTFALSLEQFTRRLQSDLDFYQIYARLDKFMRVPGLHRHVFRLTGLWGRNDLNTTRRVITLPESKIRGLPSFTWKSKLFQGSLEYQLPLVEIERSTPWLPIFLQRLHMSVFGDGAQFKNVANRTKRLYSVGLELRLDLVLGYLLPGRARLGGALPLKSGEGASVFFAFEL